MVCHGIHLFCAYLRRQGASHQSGVLFIPRFICVNRVCGSLSRSLDLDPGFDGRRQSRSESVSVISRYTLVTSLKEKAVFGIAVYRCEQRAHVSGLPHAGNKYVEGASFHWGWGVVSATERDLHRMRSTVKHEMTIECVHALRIHRHTIEVGLLVARAAIKLLFLVISSSSGRSRMSPYRRDFSSQHP